MTHLSREGVRCEWGGQEVPELILREPAGYWRWSEGGVWRVQVESFGRRQIAEGLYSMFSILILILEANGSFWKIFMLGIKIEIYILER